MYPILIELPSLIVFFLFSYYYSPLIGSIICLSLFLAFQLKTKRYISPTTLLSRQSTMRSIIYDLSYPKKLKYVPSMKIPLYGPNQVFIKVMASSINPVDFKVITPKLPFIRFFVPHTVGRDFSGIIIEKGPNVTKFNIGDHVFGNATGGSLQEYTYAEEDHIAIKDQNLTWTEAAALGLAGATSLQSLYKGNIKTNSNVLIIGASGGCGLLGTVIAKKIGARVVGVCSGKNFDRVKEFGANLVIDYTKENFLNEIKNEKFDIIFDTVTSPFDTDQFPIFRRFLKEDGRFIAINGNAFGFFRGIIGKVLFDFPIDKHYLVLLDWNNKDLSTVRNFINKEYAEKLIDSEFLLNQKDVENAFDKLKSRRAKGKIVIKIE